MAENNLKNVMAGRRRIYTNQETITRENVLTVLQESLKTHEENVREIQYLEDFYLGKQDINRAISTDVGEADNKLVLNFAQTIVRDIVGYTFGKDIEYIANKETYVKDVETICNSLRYENASLIDVKTANYLSICGVGYQIVLQGKDFADPSPEIGISIDNLKPQNTFAVHSYAMGNPIIMTCNYAKIDNASTIYYVYTDDTEFVITAKGDEYEIKEKKHLLGGNPISYFENNEFLTGDFETVLSLLDAINKVSSDSVNDIENFVHSLLVFVNADLGETDEERKATLKRIKENRTIELLSPKGLPCDAKYIATQLNPQSVKELREHLEETLWKIVGMPDRKTRGGGGGDTGDAVKLRDGWADIEVVARQKEKYFSNGKRNVLRIVINLLKKAKMVSEDLKLYNVEPRFSRNKNDNILVKTQAYSNLINTKTLTPTTCLEVANFVTNVNDVAANGEQYWNEKMEENMQREQEAAINAAKVQAQKFGDKPAENKTPVSKKPSENIKQ